MDKLSRRSLVPASIDAAIAVLAVGRRWQRCNALTMRSRNQLTRV